MKQNRGSEDSLVAYKFFFCAVGQQQRLFTHMIKQVLNNDFMSRSSSLHQRSETRPGLPVDERKTNEKAQYLYGVLQ